MLLAGHLGTRFLKCSDTSYPHVFIPLVFTSSFINSQAFQGTQKPASVKNISGWADPLRDTEQQRQPGISELHSPPPHAKVWAGRRAPHEMVHHWKKTQQMPSLPWHWGTSVGAIDCSLLAIPLFKGKKNPKLVYVSWKLNLFWVSNVISYRVHPKKSDKKSFIARKFKSALLLSIKQKSLQFWLELIFFTW